MNRTQVIIPGLPEHLRAVPLGPSGPDDENRPQVIQNWLDWAEGVVAHRVWTWSACEGLIPGVDAKKQQEIEYVRCQLDPLYCITMYMHVYETNPDLLKLYPWYREEAGGWLPAIPFEFQCRMIRWMEARSRGDDGARGGYIGKPRRMGATDMMANYALAKWLVNEPYSAKFISRRANLVYDKGNMDAILQRILAKLDDTPGNAPIPHWLLPPGWTMDYVAEMKIMRPDNKNLLGGEATTSTAGRGGRATEGFLDEAAVMDKLGFVIGAIQATVRTLFIASSETVETSEEFVDNKEKAKARNPLLVFEMDYWEHPFQDRQWLKEEEQRYIDAGNHEAFFREILRDARVGFAGWMYEDAQKITVLSEGENPQPNVNPLDHPSGSIDVLMDPGYADETALHWVLMDAPGVNDTVLQSYTQKGMPAEYYAAIIAGANPNDFPEYNFPYEVQEIMAWIRELDEHGMHVRRLCGDPYGRQSRAGPNAQGVDDSWYGRMIRWWELNNPVLDEYKRPRIIPILTNWSVKDARSFQGRRQAMMHWLRMGLQFNDTPQVRQTLLALQRTRWFETDRRITEQKDTYHDHFSHRRSAMEYGAVNREEFLWTAGDRPADRRDERFTQRRRGDL
ncbi:MAG: hypothetical protein EKK55_23525 [Rhodocyclaceae bacterium]|nr:MAG: hypothetical protein EKK55_23525 [Rhodocyclaceae bacterium]